MTTKKALIAICLIAASTATLADPVTFTSKDGKTENTVFTSTLSSWAPPGKERQVEGMIGIKENGLQNKYKIAVTGCDKGAGYVGRVSPEGHALDQDLWTKEGNTMLDLTALTMCVYAPK